MKKVLRFIFIFPYMLAAQLADVVVNANIRQIAFGSCSKQNQPDKQLWTEVNRLEPDLWIWLGDNIYGDTEDMEVMRSKYDQQKSHAGYQKLLANTEVIGIWDDHDYGVNDGGKEYQPKTASKMELFRFLDIATDHPARDREGAYQSYTYTGAGGNIKIILLDTRYFRDSLAWINPGTHDKEAIINPNGDILGEAQWIWLTEQLSESNIDLFILGSGIQVIAAEHRWEKWANFPQAQNQLMDLIKNKMDVPLILLSGDRHLSEVSKMKLEDHPFYIWDLTSSSLNSPSGIEEETNRFRVGNFIPDPNFALMTIKWKNKYPVIELSYIGDEGKIFDKYSIDFK